MAMLSKLCEKCQHIFDNWTHYTKFTIFQVLTAPEHYNISGLKTSASKGCHICILFCDYQSHRYEGVAPSPAWDAPLRIFVGSSAPDSKCWTLNLWVNNATMSSIMVDPSTDAIEPDKFSRSVSTSSNEAHLLVEKWYQECLNSHKACTSYNGGDLPTRLLDVQISNQSRDIRLCDSKDLHSQVSYATLSHCWGSLSMLCLTEQNAKQLYQSIPLTDLCKTFQDAIAIARWHNLPYLWIDSLCIIQDEPDDWKRESVQMSSVYGSSALNIAAAGAKDGATGCFMNRNPLASRKCYVKLDFADDTGGVLYECAPARLYYHCVGGTPLGQRAWAFQERFLAPRTIHYGASQLFWHCEQLDACEMYPQGLPDKFRYEVTYQKKQLSPELWPSIVAQYSRCSLSYETDKFPAISGVAKWIANKSNDKYLAGLWRNNLEPQLLWGQDDNGPPHAQRPAKYRAPSWSWAAMDGAVDFTLSPAESTGCQMRTRILNVEVKTVDNDPFGQVLSGVLRLSCCRLLMGTTQPAQYSSARKYFKLGNGTVLSLLVSPKELEDIHLPIYLLPILERSIMAQAKQVHSLYGLILRPHGEKKGHYWRIACFYAWPDDQYKEAESDPENWIPESEYEEIIGPDEDGVRSLIISIF